MKQKSSWNKNKAKHNDNPHTNPNQPNSKQHTSASDQSNQTPSIPWKLIGNIAALALIIYVGVTYVLPRFQQDNNNGIKTNDVVQATIHENGDMIIAVADISDQAIFHAYDHDGVHVEVMAVMATDGTIRTAFNTCQVCYSSGKGYYVQEGNYLICQNCKNVFHRDMVEVAKGGCNPVPIFDEDITMTETEIIIPAEYLAEAAQLFANWSRG